MKQKIVSVLAILVIVLMVIYSPWGNNPEPGSFTEVLRGWSEGQEEVSDKFTTAAVSGVEGTWVGEHEVDGSNWAIPNIIRHLIGVN